MLTLSPMSCCLMLDKVHHSCTHSLASYYFQSHSFISYYSTYNDQFFVQFEITYNLKYFTQLTKYQVTFINCILHIIGTFFLTKKERKERKKKQMRTLLYFLKAFFYQHQLDNPQHTVHGSHVFLYTSSISKSFTHYLQ